MPYDTKHTFEETTGQHTVRLGQSQRWTKIRRRALLLKLDGLTPDQVQERMGISNCPCALATAGAAELMAALAVTTGPGERKTVLVPDPEAALPGPRGLEQFAQVVGQHYGRYGDKEALARAGVMLGQPYGYTRRGTQTVVVAGQPRRVPKTALVQEKAEAVRFLFDWYLQGWSFPKIARALNRRQIPPRFGRFWRPDTLRDMLRNPVYAGYVLCRGAEDRNRRDAGTLYPGLHEPIVSWETFCQAQDVRALRHPRNPRPFWECPWQNAPERKGERE